MTPDKAIDTLNYFMGYIRPIIEYVNAGYARYNEAYEAVQVLANHIRQTHICEHSGYECKPQDKKVDIEVELDDETIVSLALYAHRHDITINEAFVQLAHIGKDLDDDELPPINETTGHDAE